MQQKIPISGNVELGVIGVEIRGIERAEVEAYQVGPSVADVERVLGGSGENPGRVVEWGGTGLRVRVAEGDGPVRF